MFIHLLCRYLTLLITCFYVCRLWLFLIDLIMTPFGEQSFRINIVSTIPGLKMMHPLEFWKTLGRAYILASFNSLYTFGQLCYISFTFYFWFDSGLIFELTIWLT